MDCEEVHLNYFQLIPGNRNKKNKSKNCEDKRNQAKTKKCLRNSKSVITHGDRSSPLQNSVPSSEYNDPEEPQPRKIVSTPEDSLQEEEVPVTNGSANSTPPMTEKIEEATPITEKIHSILEDNCKINGFDHTDNGKLMNEPDDDTCLIQCIYVTQQCCECTII